MHKCKFLHVGNQKKASSHSSQADSSHGLYFQVPSFTKREMKRGYHLEQHIWYKEVGKNCNFRVLPTGRM